MGPSDCSSLIIVSISDIKTNVEIWKERHPNAIMDILAEVVKDLNPDVGQTHNDENYFEGDHKEDDDWNALLNDGKLMDLDWDNLSTSDIFDDGFTFTKVTSGF